MWPVPASSSAAAAAASSRYGFPPEVGMFVVAPATSFHHPHPTHPDPALISAAAADQAHSINVGVIPLLTAGPCSALNAPIDDSGDLVGNRSRAGAIQFWQNQQQTGYLNKTGSINFDPSSSAVNLLNSGGLGGGGGGGGVVGSGGTTTCQDCGNQAKKDCSHRRCRTCCKSRGFDCATHVKSTWVPAARRRERQMMAVTGGGGGGGASSGSTSGAKKPRLIASATTSHTSNSNTPPRSYDTSSSHQDAGFKESLPGQVRAPAVFKCVRVTGVDNGEDEYAYQAVVRIGGRVFKGFLYDQGAVSGDGFPNLSDLHLGDGGGGRNGAGASSPLLDPSEVYGGSGGGILGGSGYGNAIN